MTGGFGLRSVRYMALESSSSDGGTFSFRCRSSHYMENNIYYMGNNDETCGYKRIIFLSQFQFIYL